ncbi:hypothetical protein HPB51_003803 [Rhipicephalus microplus]|uniref:Uncharacterized protein n=1 Tax=Rhipicephalus microplus TaxID=6941 RepID=A0A9J6EEY5_RHIMP|nr:hypothetical protein HPB51_003803 [Rhipicephalus microplus]
MPVPAGASSTKATLRTRRENENAPPTRRPFEFCRRGPLGSRWADPCGSRFNCGLTWFDVDSGFNDKLTTASGIGHGGWVFFSSTRFGLAARGPKLTNVFNAPTQAERPLYPRRPCVGATRKWYCDDGQNQSRLFFAQRGSACKQVLRVQGGFTPAGVGTRFVPLRGLPERPDFAGCVKSAIARKETSRQVSDDVHSTDEDI